AALVERPPLVERGVPGILRPPADDRWEAPGEKPPQLGDRSARALEDGSTRAPRGRDERRMIDTVVGHTREVAELPGGDPLAEEPQHRLQGGISALRLALAEHRNAQI